MHISSTIITLPMTYNPRITLLLYNQNQNDPRTLWKFPPNDCNAIINSIKMCKMNAVEIEIKVVNATPTTKMLCAQKERLVCLFLCTHRPFFRLLNKH